MSKTIKIVVALVIVVIGVAVLVKAYHHFTRVTPVATTQPAISNSSPSTQSASPQTQANTVTFTQNGFSPATLTIKAGETVTWINKSGTDATVNSDPHPVHTDYPPLNLGQFADGQTLTLTFDKPGTYGYHDHLDPSLRGTIVVQ